MRTLYSNPNRFRRTLDFSHVHNSDLETLMTARQRSASRKIKAERTERAQAFDDRDRKAMESVRRWNYLLQKARRLHRKVPRIPKTVKKRMSRIGMNPPRV